MERERERKVGGGGRGFWRENEGQRERGGGVES